MSETLDACPLCANSTFSHFLTVKDYLVTHKSFDLVTCNQCSFIFTNPRPSYQEISNYYQSEDYISHSDRSSGLMDTLYFLARNFMLRRKFNWLKQYTQNKGPVLDYGCGTGAFIQYLLKKDWPAYGVEPEDGARRIANQSIPNTVFKHLGDLPVQQFTTITLWHVLEHLHFLEEEFEKILCLLDSEGSIVIAVPNCHSLDAQYYGQLWAGFDVPRHLSHFTPTTIQHLAKKHGMQVVKILPLILDAYYISLLSEKHQQGSILNAIYQGFRSNLYARKNNMNYSSLVYILKHE